MKSVDTLLEDIRLVSEERHATVQAVRGLVRELPPGDALFGRGFLWTLLARRRAA